MRAKIKCFCKIVFPIVIIGLLLLVAASLLVTNASGNYTFSYVNESQCLQSTYFKGATITIPEGQFVGDDTVVANTLVRLPNGNVVDFDEITLTNVGKYEVIYSAKVGTTLLQENKYFLVQQAKYDVSKKSASVEYVNNFVLKNGTVNGLKVSLPSGASFNFNQVLDLNDFDKIETLVEGYLVANTQGVYSAKTVTFRFTDIHDKNNYFDFVVDAAYDNGQGSGMSYYRVGAYNQTTSGWGGNTNEKDYTGEKENRYFVGDYGAWAGALHWSTAENLESSQKVAFSMDYNTKEIFGQGCYPNKIIADLDSVEDFGMNPWKGFATGECTLTISASAYNDSQVTMLLTKIGKETDELHNNVYADLVKPNLSVDLQGYDKANLPNAVVGCKYPIFTAVASDSYSSFVNLDVKVIYNKYGSNFCNIAIVDGSFVPSRLGIYTIVYTATDASGVVAEQEYNISCDTTTPQMEVSFADSSTLTVLAGQEIELPSVNVTGALGNYETTIVIKNATDNTVLNGNSYIPMKAGSYDVVYTVKDFVGQVGTKVLELMVTAGNNPVFMDEPVLPRYLVGGYENVIPSLTAIDFQTGNEIQSQIWIKEGSSAQRKINGNVFTPTVSDNPYTLTITYVADLPTGSESKSYSLPCYSYLKPNGIDKKSMFVLDEGVTSEYAQIGRTWYAAFSATPQLQSPSIEFVNAIYANGLLTEFGVWEDFANYGRLNVYLSDAQNNATIKISYFIESGGVSVSVNDGIKYSTADYFANNLDLGFDNVSSTILWHTGDQKVVVTHDMDGNVFEGFDSGKVYITYEMEQLTGKSGLIVKTLNGQIINSSTSSGSIASTAIVPSGAYQTRMSIDDVLVVYSAVSAKVSEPYKLATVTVKAPDGSVVTTVDGKLLKDLSTGSSYQVKLSQYGTYTITYTSTDSKSKQQLVTVVDEQVPIIEFAQQVETDYALGETINLSATAKDNITATNNMKVTFILETPQGTSEYLGQGSVTYQFRKAGVYTIRAFTCDEYGNYAYIVTTVEVK